jgi:HK97 family phage portal protein
MGPLARFRQFFSRFARQPDPLRVYVPVSQAGSVVTEDSALTSAAVSACVRIIAETLGALPWHVYRRLPGGGREALPAHPVEWFLNVQASPEHSAFAARRTLIAHYLLYGNCFAEIERGLDGRAVWLWPLQPDRVKVQRDAVGVYYLYTDPIDEKEKRIDRENMLHVPDLSHEGLVGVSRVAMARRAIGVALAQDKFSAAFFANGASVGGVIENKGKALSPEAKDLLLTEFNQKYGGPDKASKTLYLDNGMEYKTTGPTMSDAAYIESRRFQVAEVARWFGVPLHLLNELADANYAISYEASKNFVEHTLRPIAVAFEQEANLKLIGAASQRQVYTRINLNGLLRGDPQTRAEYYRAMVNAGVMSINEVRALEELNAIGDEGDAHYLQMNMTTLERIEEGENLKRATAPARAPAAEEPEESTDDQGPADSRQG